MTDDPSSRRFHALRGLATAFLWLSLLFTSAAWGAVQASGEGRIDSVARLLAGLPPTHPEHAALAESAAWQEHTRELQASWARVRDGQGAAIVAWRKTDLPKGCPAGNTLLYPFSGPDFLNAYWLFPDCQNYVLFGLERPGVVPQIEKLQPEDFAKLLGDLRSFMVNLFHRNYFVTETMHKGMRTGQVRGMVPVFMVLMVLSGVEVVDVRRLELKAKTPPEPAQPGQTRRWKLRGVTIDFRVPGSPQVRQLHYFALDASDAEIGGYPHFLDYVRSLGPTTTLIKSASYLLHGREFSRMREAILDASAFIVQDDTGLPHARLVKRGWQLQFYGTYGVPIPPFEYAYQPALAAIYEKQKPPRLPFRFGYHTNLADDRSNLMIARLPAGHTRAPAAPTAPASR